MSSERCALCGSVAAGDWLCAECRSAATGTHLVLSGPSLGERSYAPESFDELAALESHSFWFRSRNRLLLWALKAHFPDASRLLEIGSGTGYVLRAFREALPEAEVVGAELYPEGLRVARERLPGVILLQADARALELEHVFDVVGAFDVLEHIDDDAQALAALQRATVPRGGLLVTVPQHAWLWSAADDFGAHKRRYSRRELVAKVEAAGYEPLLVTSFVSFLLPLMAVDRLRPRAASVYDFRREFQRRPVLDRVLEKVMTVERSLIRTGISLPFGGSLLLVARKRPT